MANRKFNPLTPEELDALLPSYTVTDLLSKDKKGAVYYAVENTEDRPVAIKVISKQVSENALFPQYFQSQLEGIKQLEHENIVQVDDFGIVEDNAYIVSKYLAGNALSKSTKGQALDTEQAVELILEIAKGLSYAHGQGIAHTDIKPQKIFLNQEARPLLANFGSFSQIRAATGKPDFGTRGYAARETLSGTFDFRSDIYSLGVVFYELLTGTLPTLPYRNPSEVVSIGTQFDDFLSKALDAKPQQRHQTVDEFAEELKLLRTQPKPSASLLLGSKAPHQQAPLSSATSTVVVQDSVLPPAFLIAALIGVLVGIGALIFAVTRSSSDEESIPGSVAEQVEEEQSQKPEVDNAPEGSRAQSEDLTAAAENARPVNSPSQTNASLHYGIWTKGNNGRRIRFNENGTASTSRGTIKGTWTIEKSLVIVYWEGGNNRSRRLYRVDPRQPDILLAVDEENHVKSKYNRGPGTTD